MKLRAAFGFAGGLLLVVSAAAHAFLGWPALAAPLGDAGVDPQVMGALAVGWYFGSVSMLTFGVIVLVLAVRTWRGAEVATAPAGIIAIAYLVFGTTAFVLRDMNPHFLLFVVTGVVVGLFALRRTRT